jgi:hypothetical protein
MLFAADLTVAGQPAYTLLRYAAWASALVSVSWTLRRAKLRRQLRQQPLLPR